MFTVDRRRAWTEDELNLALDLHFDHHPTEIDQRHWAVAELSALLRMMPGTPPGDVRFRSPAAVYKKLCNFLRLDPMC